MKLADAKKQTKFRLLQVGESGQGKTTRGCTATQFGPMLVMDFDDKLAQLSQKIPKDQVELIELERPNSYEASMELLDKLQVECPFSTIMIDTWSRLHDLEIEHHRAANPRVKKFSFDDWGVIKNMNREFVQRLLQLPCNLIINCHVGKKMDAQDNQVLTVGTTGSFGQELPQYFQETHFLFYEMGKFKVKVTKSSRIVANTGLPESMYDDKGILKDNTLAIFGEVAYRVREEEHNK